MGGNKCSTLRILEAIRKKALSQQIGIWNITRGNKTQFSPLSNQEAIHISLQHPYSNSGFYIYLVLVISSQCPTSAVVHHYTTQVRCYGYIATAPG